MKLRPIAAFVALMLAFVLPFGNTFAASGSSTNAGKLARSAKVAKRRAGGRIVRRKKARVTSRRASTKRSTKRRAAKSRTVKRRSAKKRRVARKGKASGRKIARKLRKSKRRVNRNSLKRRTQRASRMARVDRGPVEAKLVKAAYSAIQTGKLKSKAQFECIPDELKAVLGQIAGRWGTVTVNSSHRSKAHNKRVGGKSRSFHLKCQAADFSVAGSHKGLVAFLRKHPLVGGYKRYPAGHFHIDVGPRRTW